MTSLADQLAALQADKASPLEEQLNKPATKETPQAATGGAFFGQMAATQPQETPSGTQTPNETGAQDADGQTNGSKSEADGFASFLEASLDGQGTVRDPGDSQGQRPDTSGSQTVGSGDDPSQASTRDPRGIEAKAAEAFQNANQPVAYTPEQATALQSSINTLANSLDHPDIVGQAVAHILQSTREVPELADLLSYEDLGLMVAGLRESYGKTITEKQTRSKKKTKTDQEAKDILADLKGMSFGSIG